MSTGIIIFIIFALVLAGIGAAGFLAVRRVNRGDGPPPKTADEGKLKEWEAMASGYDAGKKARDAAEASLPWSTLDAVQSELDRLMPVPLTVRASCLSLDEYKAFDARKWLTDGFGRDEVGDLLAQSDAALAAWDAVMDRLDLACVQALDEKDALTRDACLERARRILAGLSGDLSVEYSFQDAATGRKYSYKQTIPRADLARMAGKPITEGPGYSPEDRHAELVRAGYRCERCGKSPLTGGRLKLHRNFSAWECLCDDCAL